VSSASPGAAGRSANLAEIGAVAEHFAAVPGPSRLPGVYTALVVDNQDPDRLGRIRVTFPWLPARDGPALSVWARMTQFAAGPNRGAWFLPEPDDEVLVAFEAGDPNRAYVLGGLWNGVDRPPVSDPEQNGNTVKRLQTRSGISITLDDSQGDEKIVLALPDGPRLELSAKDGLTLQASADTRIVIGKRDIEIRARDLTAEADRTLNLEAGTDLTIESDRDLSLQADRDLNSSAIRDMRLQGRNVTQVETG
jgi:uncharacterized protein involved in type VI secretion and phage assembly